MRAPHPCLFCATALADSIHLKSGKKIEGAAVAEDPEVVVNPFNSTVPGMTLGVQRFPKEKVKSIDRTPPPEQQFQRRLLRIIDGPGRATRPRPHIARKTGTLRLTGCGA